MATLRANSSRSPVSRVWEKKERIKKRDFNL